MRPETHRCPRALLLVWAFALLTAILLATLGVRWIQPLQERVTDLVWRLGSSHEPEQRIILLDIDERSLQEIGPWPWDRTHIAQLMEQLATQGAAQQIWDIVFTDPRAGDSAVREQIAVNAPVLSQIFALPGQGVNIYGGQLSSALDWNICPPPLVVLPAIWVTPTASCQTRLASATLPPACRVMAFCAINPPSCATRAGPMVPWRWPLSCRPATSIA